MNILLKTLFILLIIYASDKYLPAGIIFLCLFICLYTINKIDKFTNNEEEESDGDFIIDSKFISKLRNLPIKIPEDKLKSIESTISGFGGEIRINKKILNFVKDSFTKNNITESNYKDVDPSILGNIRGDILSKIGGMVG